MTLRGAFLIATGFGAAITVALGLWGSPSLLEAYFAGLGATVVGLLLGIPAALFLIREQRARESAETKRDRERRKRDVLIAVERELSENLADLFMRTAAPALGRQIMAPALSVEVWRAVSESGELQYVADTELLRVMARAYRFLGQTRAFEEMAWRSMTSEGATPFRERLAQTDEITKAAMDEAVAAISLALGEIEPP